MLFYNTSKLGAIKISLWNGCVMGGGCGFSMFSEIRIATEKSIWAMPESSIGFFTDSGTSYHLNNMMDPSLASFLVVTGHKLIGKEIVKYGIATHYIHSSKVDLLKKYLNNNVNRETTLS